MHRRNNEVAHGDYVPIVRFEALPVSHVRIGTNITIRDPHNIRMLIERLQEVLDTHSHDNRWKV